MTAFEYTNFAAPQNMRRSLPISQRCHGYRESREEVRNWPELSEFGMDLIRSATRSTNTLVSDTETTVNCWKRIDWRRDTVGFANTPRDQI